MSLTVLTHVRKATKPHDPTHASKPSYPQYRADAYIEAVEIIHSVATVPVVYITAYPERLLTGTRSEPLFLINKPYDPDVVEAAVRQALYLESRRGPGSAGEWQPSRGGRHSAA
jgi:hypothetical protein